MDKKLEELSNTLLDQIEKLNDDSLYEDKEAAKTAIAKSKVISDLASNVVAIHQAQLDETRLKIEAVKIAMDADGYNYSKFLGIEEDKK